MDRAKVPSRRSRPTGRAAQRLQGTQDSYSADGSVETSTSLFRADGSHLVDVRAPGQTFTSQAFDTFQNHGAPDTTFVFTPNHGLDVVTLFRVGGTDRDTLSFRGSDFGSSVAEVLRNTSDRKGGGP